MKQSCRRSTATPGNGYPEPDWQLGRMMSDDVEILGTGRFLRLIRRGKWEIAERTVGTAVVGVIAVTDAGELVLVEQYRPAVAAPCIELPAGLVGDDDAAEGLEVAARRELEEETGFEARHWTYLYEGASSAGLTPETIHLFLATGLRRVGPGGGDASEDIMVHVVPLEGIEAWLAGRQRAGCCVDIKLFGALVPARAAFTTRA